MAGNGGAVNAVTGDRVVSRAVVHHRHGRIVGGRINAVIQHDRRHAAGVMNTRGDDRVLIGSRQRRLMRHFINRRAGVADGATVSRARRSQIERDRQSAGCLQPVSVEAQQDFRPAAEPARFESQRRRLTGGQRGVGQCALGGIRPGPNPVATTQVERVAAGVAGRFAARPNVIALQRPAGQARFKVRIAYIIRPGPVRQHFDIVHEAFPHIQNADLNSPNAGQVIRAQIEDTRRLDVGP